LPFRNRRPAGPAEPKRGPGRPAPRNSPTIFDPPR
jgi:hypothetical protein